MSPAEIVQRQLDTYNAQDLDGFCACFAQDCLVGDLNGAVTQRGLAEVRQRYAALFAQYPENRARLISRMHVGDVVVDHEDIARSPDTRFQAIAIYTVRDGLISRVDFVRAQ